MNSRDMVSKGIFTKIKAGCVYAATSRFYMYDGLIKIGSTSKQTPHDRLKQLSKQQPIQFVPLMWVTVYSQKSAETLLHRFFHRYKYDGGCGVEWFKNIPDKELRYGFQLIADLNLTLPIIPGYHYVDGKWELDDIFDSVEF